MTAMKSFCYVEIFISLHFRLDQYTILLKGKTKHYPALFDYIRLILSQAFIIVRLDEYCILGDQDKRIMSLRPAWANLVT